MRWFRNAAGSDADSGTQCDIYIHTDKPIIIHNIFCKSKLLFKENIKMKKKKLIQTQRTHFS